MTTSASHGWRLRAALARSLDRLPVGHGQVARWALHRGDAAAEPASTRPHTAAPFTEAPAPEPAEPPAGPTRLEALLLGPFEVAIDGRPVTGWRGQLGPSLLKYLLAQPKLSAPRDVLLEQFWPGADADRARNRLHVAVTSLRRTLRTVTAATIVEFHDGRYRISPELDVDLDVERFERLVEEGLRADLDADAERAAALLWEAASLHRGDFLADSPYEEWTVLPRESLRIAYLDLLDHLARLEATLERTSECIDVAQRVLREDACREDAHRLLMRCYARQGRAQQVSRQFELCCHLLRERLGAGPAPSTVSTYRDARAEADERRQHDWPQLATRGR